MKVLKEGHKHEDKPIKITCSTCKSELEYMKADIQSDRDGAHIICPVCTSYISVEYPKTWNQ